MKNLLLLLLAVVSIVLVLGTAPVLAQPSGEPNGELGDEEGEDPDAKCTEENPRDCQRLTDPGIGFAVENVYAQCAFRYFGDSPQDQIDEVNELFDCLEDAFADDFVFKKIDSDGNGVYEAFSITQLDGDPVDCMRIDDESRFMWKVGLNLAGLNGARIAKFDSPRGESYGDPDDTFVELTIGTDTETLSFHLETEDPATGLLFTASELNGRIEGWLVGLLGQGYITNVTVGTHWPVFKQGGVQSVSVRTNDDGLRNTAVGLAKPTLVSPGVLCGDPSY